MSEPSSPQSVNQPTASGAGPEREWLTYAEAGQMVGLSRVTLWKLVSAGEVEVARVGRAVRINRESLTTYMKRSAASPTPAGSSSKH
jgi:excisionase family DNA binding protein